MPIPCETRKKLTCWPAFEELKKRNLLQKANILLVSIEQEKRSLERISV